jgi:hypothetical protein
MNEERVQNGGSSSQTTACPFCKHDIVEGARICPHCTSRIDEIKPQHGGTCPECKSQIDPEAIRCRFCKCWVSSYGHRSGPAPSNAFVPQMRMQGEGPEPFDDFGDHEPPWRVCRRFIDMSTFESRNGSAWRVEECDYYSTDPRKGVIQTIRRRIQLVRLSQREIDRWWAVST